MLRCTGPTYTLRNWPIFRRSFPVKLPHRPSVEHLCLCWCDIFTGRMSYHLTNSVREFKETKKQKHWIQGNHMNNVFIFQFLCETCWHVRVCKDCRPFSILVALTSCALLLLRPHCETRPTLKSRHRVYIGAFLLAKWCCDEFSSVERSIIYSLASVNVILFFNFLTFMRFMWCDKRRIQLFLGVVKTTYEHVRYLAISIRYLYMWQWVVTQ